MELIILEGYGNIEWTILPTPKDKNKYQYKYPNKKILFVKLTERSEDDEFIKYSYYFLLGDMKVWLQSDTMLEPTLHQQQQHLNNNTASSIIQISDGPNTKVSIEFSSLLEFSNWFDEIRKTIALLIINHTLHNIQSIQVVQTPLLFQCLKRCYELIYDHELDLVRIRNLLAVKQQILYCVNGWRAKTVSSDAILFTIQKFMCHILLAHFEPLILGMHGIIIFNTCLFSLILYTLSSYVTVVLVLYLQMTLISKH